MHVEHVAQLVRSAAYLADDPGSNPSITGALAQAATVAWEVNALAKQCPVAGHCVLCGGPERARARQRFLEK